MPALTGRQKRFLRGLGQQLDPLATIGKAGLSDEAAANLQRLMDAHELVKVQLPPDLGGKRKEYADELADAIGAVCAGLVGRMALLYRPSETLDPARRLALP